jgi:phthalate 4,5-dioxygenase oxygenase subunit
VLTPEENNLLTQTGPGTPGGRVLRRFWQPVALVRELPPARPVKAVRVLGEDLVVFRDEAGRYGAIERRCAHRGADLSFGRLEGGGLRCTFHGWLYDVEGRCLVQPAERRPFNDKVRHRAYPCREINGIVFAYMGDGPVPELPKLDCFVAPAEYTFAFKGYVDCNWAQGLEGGIDPSHTSFLHVFFRDPESPAYGRQFGDVSEESDIPLTKIMREYYQPLLEVRRTEYGLRLETRRPLGNGREHVRVTNLVFPNLIVVPMSRQMVLAQWHVPVDDARHYWYMIAYSFGEPVDQEAMWQQRVEMYPPPDFVPVRNRSNNYGFSPEEQRTETYTGLGHDINIHDTWAWEGQGTVQDRSREHLGPMDRAITAFRRLFIAAARASGDGNQLEETLPVGLRRGREGQLMGPPAVDLICPGDGWNEYWREKERARREGSTWAGSGGARRAMVGGR